jgi:hypothetical protein
MNLKTKVINPIITIPNRVIFKDFINSSLVGFIASFKVANAELINSLRPISILLNILLLIKKRELIKLSKNHF